MLLFCSDPLEPRNPDPAFAREVEAAQRAGLEISLVDYEALVNEKSPAAAVRRVPQQSDTCCGVYRGWMLKPNAYAQLFQAVASRGVQLINDPEAYQHCHHLPASYAKIAQCTPKSVWLPLNGEPSFDEIMALLRVFGYSPVIVKDYVKSRKHEWEQACFIPAANDRAHVERVVRRFIELQDDDINEGLVFREFVRFKPLASHVRSGMPLTKEYRLMYLDGNPVLCTPYWDTGNYDGDAPSVEKFADVARSIESRFFSMDVAQRTNGDWLVVELGDGQVAGLPENAELEKFYRALAEQWPLAL